MDRDRRAGNCRLTLVHLPASGQNGDMMFVLFIATVFATCLFHRWEHRVMIDDLRRLLPALGQNDGKLPDGHDWRVIARDHEDLVLRRAFMVPDKTAALRYAVPVFMAAVMMIVLGQIAMGIGYAAFCAVKWFGSDVRLQTESPAGYAVYLGSTKIFGEPL